MADIKELKKLPPEERIKKLKELSEKNKKEIEEAQAMLKDSEDEVEENEELLRKVPIPQIRAVDIDSLFSEEEKDAFSTVRFVGRKKEAPKKKEEAFAQEKSLEATVEREKPQLSEKQLREQQQYFHRAGTERLQELREEIYGSLKKGGYDHSVAEQYHLVQEEMEQRSKDFADGKYKTSDKKVAEILGLHAGDDARRQYGL